MSTHTSTVQEKRFWAHEERYNGLNGNFLGFLCEVSKEMTNQMNNKKDNSRMYKVIERANKYIYTIYNNNLSSKTDIQNNADIKKLREIIKHVPLPAKEDTKKRVARIKKKNEMGQEIEIEINSDFECEKPSGAHGWPKGWCDSTQEREVSNYIKNVIDAAIFGPAMEVVMNMGMSRDRTGFETIERLADVYGRSAAHIMLIPNNFVWGKNSLIQDWSNYKHKIENTEYLRLHPQSEAMVVHLANTGFDQYSHSFRILDHIRTNAGENPTWQKFKEVVDNFLGDTHRTQFCQGIYEDRNGLQSMTTAAVIQTKEDEPNHINYIASQFQGKKSKGKGKGKSNNNNNKTYQAKFSQASSNLKPDDNKSDKNQKAKKKCAWCGEQNHPTWKCRTWGNGKWDNKECNRCKGRGHPQEACSNPPKKEKKDVVMKK